MSWRELYAHNTKSIREKLILINNSIWYSTDYDRGANGMEEYCIKTNTIISKVSYPENIKPMGHSICEYNNQIYIIDGYNGQIIVFNPFTKSFYKQIKITKIGHNASCIAINSDIHIFYAKENSNIHLIFSTKTHKIKTIKDERTTQTLNSMAVLKYMDKIIRFGGYNWKTNTYMDTFLISSSIEQNIKTDWKYKSDNIIWKIKTEWKLRKGLFKCGYILYKHYIITFGGKVEMDPNKYTDSIYVLNMRGNNGWIKLKDFNCPMPSQFTAILDSQNNIHIFSQYNNNKVVSKHKHYSLPISVILNQINDEQKCSECDVLRTKVNGLQRLVNELLNKQNEIEIESNEIKAITQQLQMEQNKMQEAESEIKEKEIQHLLEQEINKLKENENKIITKYVQQIHELTGKLQTNEQKNDMLLNEIRDLKLRNMN